jgi:hypothetical protein
MPVLKLRRHDAKRELRFELDYQATLSVEQRFDMLEERKRIFLEQLIGHGHRRPFEIIKRS